tara:strand:+ start:1062 stop:2489 length:1428 start_codon:yes stop_codon:yes gene_type:complete
VAVGSVSDSWASFRNGGSNSTTVLDFPTSWSPENGISWQRELPGYGQSTPLLWREILYLTYVEGPQKDLSVVLACDAKTGERVWEFPISTSSPDASWYAKSRAAPTPVLDSQGIYAFFEGGDLVALNHNGDLRWQRSLSKEYGEIKTGHGLGASLAQTDDAIFVLVDHEGPAYLLSVDKATGKNRWKSERSSRISWSSPVVAKLQETLQIIVSSNGSVDGYNAANGKLIWTLEDVSGNTITSPTVSGNCVFVGAKKESATFCLQFLVDAKLGDYRQIWKNDSAICNYASPLVYRENVYVVDSKGVIHCLDKGNGKTRFAEKIADACWATPIALDNQILFLTKTGAGTFIKTGPEFQPTSTNFLWKTDNPPAPVSYVQHPPGDSNSTFVDRLRTSDDNGDGFIAKSELPELLQRSFGRLDTSGDGFIDLEEIEAIENRIRMANASTIYDDPIVYGFVVGNRSIYVRTGTRIYCIRY